MTLQDVPVGFAIDEYQTHYFYPTLDELITLRITGSHKVQRRVWHSNIDTDCIPALFLDDKQKIKEQCQYSINTNVAKPEIQALDNNQFLFSKVMNYSIKCANSTDRTYYAGCENCIIHVPNSCTLTTQSHIIIRAFVDQKEKFTDPQIMHAINRPILSYFYSPENLRAIHGDSVYLQDPSSLIQIPNITFKQPKIRDFVAEDNRLSYNLERTMEAINRDSYAVHSVQDSIMLSSEDQPNIFGPLINYLTIVELCDNIWCITINLHFSQRQKLAVKVSHNRTSSIKL